MRTAIATVAVMLCLVFAGTLRSQGQAPSNPGTPAPAGTLAPSHPQAIAPSSQRTLINRYCVACHNDKLKSGGLTLSELNLDAVHQSAEVAEKVIRKLRGGLMPPAGAKRPDARTAAEFVTWLESKIDAAATESKPGRVALRRLNRREYAIRDPRSDRAEHRRHGLAARGQHQGQLRQQRRRPAGLAEFHGPVHLAARAVALEAIGNPKAPAETITYGDVANMVISLPPAGAPGTGRQQHRLEGMPFGTRGGFSVEHNFPADGDYELTIGDMALAREVPRMEFENTVIALLDGKEFYRTTIGGEADHKAIDQRLDPAVEEINGRLRKIRFKATPGSTSWRSRSCIAASPRATSARARSRSRAARSASRPRTRCRSAGRCRSPA